MDMIWIVLICVSACVLLIPLSVVLWITLHGLWMYLVAVCKRPMKRYIEEIKAREDYVTIDKIAPFFLEAIVVSEDFRFFEHKGYSVVAMRKAFLLNVRRRKIVTGGSGITQQLAKNLYFSFRRIYARKLAELLVVLRLEKYYSKMELLELYVNIIEYGQGCNGIEKAPAVRQGLLLYFQCHHVGTVEDTGPCKQKFRIIPYCIFFVPQQCSLCQSPDLSKVWKRQSQPNS